jgi:biopolymer transport protein ExbD
MRRYKLDEKEFSEINITPFTDVVLVLLIIFMITSPFLITGSYKVKLPKSVNSETDVSKGIEVYLTENSELSINNNTISFEDIAWRIKNEFESMGTKDVIIKADKNVKHGIFIQLLDELKKAGAEKLLISTTKFGSNSP